MARFEGSLARTLDLGDVLTPAPVCSGARSGLRLASPGGLLGSGDKYKVLEKRRRQAQIKARHMLNLIDVMEGR